MARFPEVRLRRLRSSPAIRSLLSETRVHPHDLVAPLFVVPGGKVRREIPSLPEQFHLSVDKAAAEAAGLFSLGVPAVLLFGVPTASAKSPDGAGAWDPEGLVPAAVAEIKKRVPGLAVLTDVCLCEYTSHGHCGVVEGLPETPRRGPLPKDLALRERERHARTLPARAGRPGGPRIANDPTLESLVRVALAHARAGADFVAPSDMMDGRVAALRSALDAAGFSEVGILSYAAKAASAFYGPFRTAAGSAPAFGDRLSHQMNGANAREALREMEQDLEEGADILMVKPGLAYLDVLCRARQAFNAPLAVYNVSGEYSMVHAAARQGLADLEAVRDESLTAFKRAGADLIVTYWARSFAESYRARRGLDPGYGR